MKKDGSEMWKAIVLISGTVSVLLAVNKFALGAKGIIPGLGHIAIWQSFIFAGYCIYNHISIKKEKKDREEQNTKIMEFLQKEVLKMHDQLTNEYTNAIDMKVTPFTDKVQMIIKNIDERNDRLEKTLGKQSEHLLKLIAKAGISI